MLKQEKPPTAQDWDWPTMDLKEVDYLDYQWARNAFIGKTREDMLRKFIDLPRSAGEDLMSMPETPFRYYVLNFKDLFTSEPLLTELMGAGNAPEAAFAFLDLLRFILQRRPNHLLPVIEELLPVAEYVSNSQTRIHALESNYGSFPELMQEIRALYESSAGAT